MSNAAVAAKLLSSVNYAVMGGLVGKCLIKLEKGRGEFGLKLRLHGFRANI